MNIGDKTNYGIIEDVYNNQYLICGRWIHEKLVCAVDNISTENIIKHLENERGTGLITLYHGTDIDSYNSIINTQIFGDGEYIYFLTDNKAEAKEYANNKAKYRGKSTGKVIIMTIPKYAVLKNEATGEYETEYKLKLNGDVWLPML